MSRRTPHSRCTTEGTLMDMRVKAATMHVSACVLLLAMQLRQITAEPRLQLAVGPQEDAHLSKGTRHFLERLLAQELAHCGLGIVGKDLQVLADVTSLAASFGIPVQIFTLGMFLSDPSALIWRRNICDAYMFLMEDFTSLLPFLEKEEGMRAPKEWDYKGYYLYVALEPQAGRFLPLEKQLESVASSFKMQKTIHSLFITPTSSPDTAEVRTHWLYTDRRLRPVALSRQGRLPKKVQLFPDKVQNLEGHPLVIMGFPHAPSVFGDVDENFGLEVTSGVDVKFIRALASYLNFTLVWSHPGPELWGSLFPNGTYTGIVGQISDGNGDIGVSSIFITEVRSQYVTFTFPYEFEQACFVTPAPRELPRWMALLFPFSFVIWMLIIVTIFLMTVLVPLITFGSPRRDADAFYSLPRSLLYVVGLFTNRSLVLPRVDALRVFSICLQWMGFVIAVSYSGNLTAFMTVKTMEPPIRTLKALDESSYQVFGFTNFWSSNFKLSSNKYVNNLVPKVKEIYTDLFPFFRKVADREGVLIENFQHLEYIRRQYYTNVRGESPLRIQEECISPYGVGAMLNKHSPLKDAIDKAILALHSGGLLVRFFQDVLGEDHRDSHKEEGPSWLELHQDEILSDGPQSLSLEHVQGAFLVFVIGLVAAFASFFVESVARCCRPGKP